MSCMDEEPLTGALTKSTGDHVVAGAFCSTVMIRNVP
ncbi:hypothetical protein M2243_002509 [Heliophilum fasciatum]|nr:hypothetical protein [Heliophilum fasciatum]